jgi:hypothetical protein
MSVPLLNFSQSFDSISITPFASARLPGAAHFFFSVFCL